MADVTMADRAGKALLAVTGGADHVGEVIVAFEAGALRHLMIASGDDDFVGKTAGGKCQGMVEPVDRLGQVLGDDAGRSMAVVADGDGAVGRLLPAAILLAHDVAIGTGRRIVGHVGSAPRVAERVDAEAEEQADRKANQQRGEVSLRAHNV